MRIDRFRVLNYKSFADSTTMRLTSGFNVIVGQNNIGKTALRGIRRNIERGRLHKSRIPIRQHYACSLETDRPRFRPVRSCLSAGVRSAREVGWVGDSQQRSEG